jgi:hypothetical protein
MEWVIAVLGVGCVFFAAQVVVDFIKYKRAIEPRLERLEQTKAELRSRIEATETELRTTRSGIGPSKLEVERLEKRNTRRS